MIDNKIPARISGVADDDNCYRYARRGSSLGS